MKIILSPRKSVFENAADYFDLSKKLRAKAEGARKAIVDTHAKLEALRNAPVEVPKERLKIAVKKEWFEKFRWFTTSGGLLVLAGRDAKQNELLVARQLEDADLFFHADVHGAPATILKKGTVASEQDKLEAAAFAAAYSSAWKGGGGAADVYAVRKEQVSKYSHGEYVAKGGFVISGQREWFKNTALLLIVAEENGRAVVFPGNFGKKIEKKLVITPGSCEKKQAAENIKKQLNIINTLDEVIQLLPAGGSSEFLKTSNRR